MRTMSDAPADGTRFLARRVVYHFDAQLREWVEDGTTVEECWYDGTKFTRWCGNQRVRELGNPVYLGWSPTPEVLL